MAFVVLTGSDNWVTKYSRDRVLLSKVCIVGLCEGGDAALNTKYSAVAVLSSVVLCFSSFFLLGVAFFLLAGAVFLSYWNLLHPPGSCP